MKEVWLSIKDGLRRLCLAAKRSQTRKNAATMENSLGSFLKTKTGDATGFSNTNSRYSSGEYEITNINRYANSSTVHITLDME